MIETKEKEINGHVYSVTQFAARRGLKLKTRLIKLLAPLAVALSGSKSVGSVLDMQIDSELVAKAVTGLTERLSESDFENLVFEMLVSTRRDGREITPVYFDEIYAASYDELYKALFFVAEVNYGSFLKGLRTSSQANQMPNPESIPSLEPLPTTYKRNHKSGG